MAKTEHDEPEWLTRKNWLESGMGDSCRLLLGSFDERLARQALADVCEVLALVWVVFVDAFPNIGPRLAAEPHLFKHTPQVRLFLPRPAA